MDECGAVSAGQEDKNHAVVPKPTVLFIREVLCVTKGRALVHLLAQAYIEPGVNMNAAVWRFNV